MNHCKILSYSQLLKMKRTADSHHDEYWSLECYDVALRYTYIAQRIIEAMARMPIENVLKG